MRVVSVYVDIVTNELCSRFSAGTRYEKATSKEPLRHGRYVTAMCRTLYLQYTKYYSYDKNIILTLFIPFPIFNVDQANYTKPPRNFFQINLKTCKHQTYFTSETIIGSHKNPLTLPNCQIVNSNVTMATLLTPVCTRQLFYRCFYRHIKL